MDLWLNPSRSNEPTSKCDFCYQTGVPVKSLSCGSHFYCGVCEKFAPKFYKRADYTCSRCPGPRRSQRQSLDLDLSPTTLNVRPVKKRQDFTEVTIAVEGGNILSFGDPDPDSGDDLEGNNVQWDNLLESLTSSQRTRGKSPKMKKIPQTESRSFSTANKADGKKSGGVGGSTRSCDDVHKKQSGSQRKSSGQKQRVDLEEQERGSSPVKGFRKRISPRYEATVARKTSEEDDDGYSPVGDVEGPDLSDSEGYSRGYISDGEGYQGGSEDEFWSF